MYKKQKNWYIAITLILMAVVYGIIMFFVCKSQSFNESEKIKLLIDISSTFFTVVALLLTYSSLKNQQQQKHLSKMPYLVIKDIDFAIEHKNKEESKLDFDFWIENKGNGIANRITIIIKNKYDKKIIFKNSYAYLEASSYDDICFLLSNISNNLSDLSKGKCPSSVHLNSGLNDEFYVENFENADNYKELLVIIKYYDIYGKKYIKNCNIKLDEYYDLCEYEEKLKEFN